MVNYKEYLALEDEWEYYKQKVMQGKLPPLARFPHAERLLELRSQCYETD